MNRSFLAAVPLLLMSGCGDPDDTRATPEAERSQPTEPAEGSNRPDVINRSEMPDETSDLAGVPLEPAIDEGERDPDYVGVWAPDLAWCENETGAEVPIQITPDTFGGYENPCEITQIDETGRQEWETDLSCAGEGQVESRRITMAVEGNRLDVVYHEIADERISYYRCEPETSESEADDAESGAEAPVVVPPE